MGTTGREHEDKKPAEEAMGSGGRHLLPEGHTRRGLGGLQRPEESSVLGEAGPNPAVSRENPCPSSSLTLAHWQAVLSTPCLVENHSEDLRGAERSSSSLA